MSEILSEIVRNLLKNRPNISRPIISRPKFLRPNFFVINVCGRFLSTKFTFKKGTNIYPLNNSFKSLIGTNFSEIKLQYEKLVKDYDVKNNPWPNFKTLKVLPGSFYQSQSKFGDTVDNCDSLYTLCWSTIKHVTVWTTWNLDYILDNCYRFFPNLNISILLCRLPSSAWKHRKVIINDDNAAR